MDILHYLYIKGLIPEHHYKSVRSKLKLPIGKEWGRNPDAFLDDPPSQVDILRETNIDIVKLGVEYKEWRRLRACLYYPNGSQIDGYHIIKRIGSGDESVIYKAVKDGKIFAVKVLASSSGDNISKIYISGSLDGDKSHSCNRISLVLESGTADMCGTNYMATEYYPKGDLGRYCRRRVRHWSDIKHHFINACMAANDLHKMGYMHCDIKPSNLFIGNDGIIKLGDFDGVADIYSSGQAVNRAGSFRCTLGFMAPEHLLNPCIASDIYSLGATLYNMVTGVIPFSGCDHGTTIYCKYTYSLANFWSYNPSVPVRIWDIIDACTRPDPKKRVVSIEQLIRDVKSIRHNSNSASPKPKYSQLAEQLSNIEK
jgi:serine/threonine protein kinase